jgi:cytochrome c-type biogenesis protein CcmH
VADISSVLKSAAGLILLTLLLMGSPAWAVIEIAPLSNETLEQRYRSLLEELRCPKCQNQNLADSNSPIAADLREQVRVMLEEGKSDDETVAFLVARYGDFVRYRPAVKDNTLVLWFAPALLLLVAVFVIVLVVRAYRRPLKSGELDADEQARLQALLQSRGQAPSQSRVDGEST